MAGPPEIVPHMKLFLSSHYLIDAYCHMRAESWNSGRRDRNGRVNMLL
jgi:hypothetical protein